MVLSPSKILSGGKIEDTYREITDIKKNFNYDDSSKTYEENSWVVTYRYISRDEIYFYASKTVSSLSSRSYQLEIAGLPFVAKFQQVIPFLLNVAAVPVGQELARINETSEGGASCMYIANNAYGANVSMTVCGTIKVNPNE